MPAKAGKTPRHVKQEYAQFVGRMTGPRTKAAMAKVLSIGISYAKDHTPMEYGTLMDSAYRRIVPHNGSWRGIAGFSGGMSEKGFNYAYWLHETFKWNNRPPEDKMGPAWNPDGEPKYLENGFTKPEQRALMQKALGEAYKI